MVEVGGGLRAYEVAGQQVLDGYGEDEVCPARAPARSSPRGRTGSGTAGTPGRARATSSTLSEPARHNAIHGLVRWVPWRLVSATGSSVTLAHDLPAQPGYPWPLAAVHDLVGRCGRAARRAHRHQPVRGGRPRSGSAAHPYLAVPGVPVDELTVTVPAASRLLLDGRKLPIGAAKVAGGDYDFSAGRRLGAARLDTAFGDVPMGGSTVTMSTVDGSRALAVWADGAFRWWQVFTGDALAAPRTRRALAVEPMTCPPDAFHSGRDLVTLAPGETWRGTWGITPTLG